MARWAYKLMTGGGVELPAFALADDGFLVLQRGKVMSGADWMPLTGAITSLSSNRGLCVRYPVRMLEDLLPLEHLQGERLAGNLIEKFGLDPETAELVVREQLTLEGTLHTPFRDRQAQRRRLRLRLDMRHRRGPVSTVRGSPVPFEARARGKEGQGGEGTVAMVFPRVRRPQVARQSDWCTPRLNTSASLPFRKRSLASRREAMPCRSSGTTTMSSSNR